jgi:hypothetical protein
MARTQIKTPGIANDAVTAAQIAAGAVGTTEIADGSIITDKLDSSIVGALVPIGGIIMWSGSVATIPSSWRLCNGLNGTPNLQDRFLVGAGSGYAVGATGGSADATLVSHSHSINDPGHSHTYSRLVIDTSQRTDLDNNMLYFNEGSSTTSLSGTGIAINSSGSSATNANLPPYYALAFIMRIS